MAEVLSINDYLLKKMKSLNPDLEVIQYNPTTNICSFEGKNIDFGEFSLLEIYNKYSQLKEDIEVMTPLDLFNILKINVAVKNITKNSVNDKEPENHIVHNSIQIHNGVINIKFKDETNNIEVHDLIDVKQYINIIEKSNKISEKEHENIKSFEDFMSELYKYKSYLSEDALAMWHQYEQYIIVASTLNNNLQNVEKAITVYNQITDEEYQIEFKNAKEKELVLKKQEELFRKEVARENRAGIASALLIVEITTFVSIALAAVLFVLLRK